MRCRLRPGETRLNLTSENTQEYILRVYNEVRRLKKLNHRIGYLSANCDYDRLNRRKRDCSIAITALSDRTFSVLSSEQQSMRVRLSCSFPQGSTLGPLLYMSLMLLSCKRLQSDMVLGSMALLMIPNLVYQLIRRMLNGPNKL